MKRAITIELLLIYCLFAYCCGSNPKARNTDAAHTDAMYVIDLDSAIEKDVFYLSDIVKKVRPILLEETDYALIGQYDKIQIFDNKIFLLDMFVAKKLFVYDLNGKYLRHIGTMGQGPGEYVGILNFCIDPENKEIYLYEYWKGKLMKYRIEDGQYLSTIDLPRNIQYLDIAFAKNSIYTGIAHYKEAPDWNDNMLAKLDLTTGEWTEYLSAEIYNAGSNSTVSGYLHQSYNPKYNNPIFARPYMNIIFSCKNDGVYPHVLVKSKEWVKNGDVPVNLDSRDEAVYIGDKCYAHEITCYRETDSCIYFQYWQKYKKYQVVYSKQTKEVYKYRSIINDVKYNILNIERERNIIESYYFNSENSKFAYDITSSGFILHGLKDNIFSAELTEQLKLLKLEEEGYVVMEFELK